MKKRTLVRIFEATNSLKVLTFLAKNPGQEFLSSEIQKAVGISRAGAYLALQELLKEQLVIRAEKGRFHLYSVNYGNPIVRQFKILINVMLLESLIFKIQPYATRIILFGSGSRGEDAASSDIDLFILSKDPENIRELLASFKTDRKMQPIILAPTEWPDFKEREKVFFEEIEKGIVLWEEKE
ncbi:MAG: nucleotidyltransferase domain-containing protein [Candidatus Aminicenantales bacterium]